MTKNNKNNLNVVIQTLFHLSSHKVFRQTRNCDRDGNVPSSLGTLREVLEATWNKGVSGMNRMTQSTSKRT